MKALKKTFLTLIAAAVLGSGMTGCAITPKNTKPQYLESIVVNSDGSEYKASGFKAPSLENCKVLLKEYAKMPEESIPQSFKEMYKTNKIGGYNPGQFAEDEEHNLAYIVQFKNKQGIIIEKFYHKTHPFAFTVKELGKTPYTIIAEKVKGPYCLKIPGELKHETYDTSHWLLNHPQPDDFNPYTDDPFPERDPDWYKACEWHKKES
ncbi:hypothetical protein FJZ53_03130 [Candidatus Woesearchaeota archaeon]|nr:hypothetical protein [Candidatus Woesearchaeota archaeon]